MYWMSVCICIIFSGKQIHWNWNWNWSKHLTLHKASHIDNNENDNNCYLPSQDLLFSDDQEVPAGYRKKWEVSTNKNTAQQSNTSFGYRTLIMKGISCDFADKQRQRNKRWNTNHTTQKTYLVSGWTWGSRGSLKENTCSARRREQWSRSHRIK